MPKFTLPVSPRYIITNGSLKVVGAVESIDEKKTKIKAVYCDLITGEKNKLEFIHANATIKNRNPEIMGRIIQSGWVDHDIFYLIDTEVKKSWLTKMKETQEANRTKAIKGKIYSSKLTVDQIDQLGEIFPEFNTIPVYNLDELNNHTKQAKGKKVKRSMQFELPVAPRFIVTNGAYQPIGVAENIDKKKGNITVKYCDLTTGEEIESVFMNASASIQKMNPEIIGRVADDDKKHKSLYYLIDTTIDRKSEDFEPWFNLLVKAQQELKKENLKYKIFYTNSAMEQIDQLGKAFPEFDTIPVYTDQELSI